MPVVLRRITIAALALCLFAAAPPARADVRAAARLRAEIQLVPTGASSRARESLRLRVTRGFSQGTSQFCWVFSALNMLETNYLEADPTATPEEVELSREYFLKITGAGTRGTVMDAIYAYSARIGLIAQGPRPPLPPPAGSLPQKTFFRGRWMTPLELRQHVLGPQLFWSYAPGGSGWGPHADPDALPGTQSLRVDAARIPGVVRSALLGRKAVAFLANGHIVTIWGADYGAQGQPLQYFIKDSYEPYFYVADPRRVHERLDELTTLAGLARSYRGDQ